MSAMRLEHARERERGEQEREQREREQREREREMSAMRLMVKALQKNPGRQTMKNELEIIHTYENQEKHAQLIMETITHKRAYFHLLLALTQSGKTGIIPAILKKLVEMENPPINLDNIYIISGVNDNDWKAQTKTRIPSGMKTHHRGDLVRLGKEIKEQELHNVLIIIDEAHVAAKSEMSIAKFIKNFEANDFKLLKEHNVHTLMLDATPNKVMDDINNWSMYVKKYCMPPGQNYRSHKDLLENDQIREFKDLYIDDEPLDMTSEETEARTREIQPAIDEIRNVCEYIRDHYTPKYHIIRVPSGSKGSVVRDRFERIGGDVFGAENATYRPIDANNKLHTIQNSIKEQPKKHKFIFIKEMARCALTFEPEDKEKIGVLYERKAKKIQDDVIIQGLAGRATGYNTPHHIIIYTSITSIERYSELWDNEFEGITDFTYAGKHNDKKTYMHPNRFENTGFEPLTERTEDASRHFEEFETHKEAKQFAIDHTESIKGPNRLNKLGEFYVKSLRKGDSPKIWAIEELVSMDNQSKGTRNNPVRYYVVYKDINDSNTAVHVLSLRNDQKKKCGSNCCKCNNWD
jgi:hypothetical protein